MRDSIKLLTILVTTISLASCERQRAAVTEATHFKLPVVSQQATNDTIEFKKATALSHAWPRFLGKYGFTTDLKIPVRRENDTSYSRDYIDDRRLWRTDSISSDGFEIYPDYKSTVSRIEYDLVSGNYYYPVYIVNQTPTTKLFIGKDSYVFAIQEAVDTNGYWRPIEGRGFDFCGNGYWGLKVHHNEFLVTLFPKYEGDHKTLLRVRMKIGVNIYVSEPYEGSIILSQFLLDNEDNYFKRELTDNKASAIQHLFYGAEPLEVRDSSFSLHAAWTY